MVFTSSKPEALELLTKYLKDERMVKHCLAVSAVMRALGRRLGRDERLWELVGLLHDIDYDYVERDMSRHGLGAMRILEGVLPRVALEAIASHNEHSGFKPTSEEAAELSHALRASDHLAGLIVATALVMPSKKLAEVGPDTLARKFKSKDFARGVSRDRIREIEKLGIDLEEFLDLGLKALKEVDRELGL
ncbi:MAG: HDIG domain-containing protein [Sulfolobales archaeon]|nr:HDIG domain-containing protein [Sulfolobales archaeon]MDW8082775.1 HDIG domain-containing protein [Sulfolobales archaeon]